ncbi:MAG: thioesterase family protein [Lentisphaeria bacterium]|jgi:acyl-CoA thioester hydrolase|nr:thioesterase family protein [Lentisphaeria bacterium]NLZ59290.1 acyl-CoA thioesterase [Lentisphaerota bacterium]
MSIVRGYCDYRVPYADSDQMGVVYYARYLSYFERARNELLRAFNFTYKEMEALGLALPVIEAHVNYKKPAHYDDLLKISAELKWLKAVRLQVYCQVCRDDELLADGYTIHAVMNLQTKKATRLPEKLQNIFRANLPEK